MPTDKVGLDTNFTLVYGFLSSDGGSFQSVRALLSELRTVNAKGFNLVSQICGSTLREWAARTTISRIQQIGAVVAVGKVV